MYYFVQIQTHKPPSILIIIIIFISISWNALIIIINIIINTSSIVYTEIPGFLLNYYDEGFG